MNIMAMGGMGGMGGIGSMAGMDGIDIAGVPGIESSTSGGMGGSGAGDGSCAPKITGIDANAHPAINKFQLRVIVVYLSCPASARARFVPAAP